MDKDELKFKREYLDRNIDGVEYIQSLIKTKKTGTIYTAMCPFHHEKTPSLRIYPSGHKNSDGERQDRTSWFCFGCKKGGDIVKFEELYYDLDSIEEACNSLSMKFHLNFAGNKELEALQMELNKIQKKDESVMSLQTINFICSMTCRRYLHWIIQTYPQSFDKEYDYIQSIYKKLDEHLLKVNALQAQNFVNLTQNTVNKRKKLIIQQNSC